MAFERIMGIDVVDDQEYQHYRGALAPILKSFGGSFGFDFKIAEVLRSKTSDNINRVFTLSFPSRDVMENFFSDPNYLVVKEKHFINSVKSTTIIAMNETTSE
jgi:uncharacterized protein (DUF1330 family)